MKSDEKKILHISLVEILFLLSFGIMILAKGIGLVEGTILFKTALLASAFCIFIKILIDKYSLIEYAYIISFILLGIIIWRVSSNQAPLLFIFILVGMKNVSLERVFKLGALIWTTTFVFQIVTHILDLRYQDFVIHHKFGMGYMIRWALGYTHPNVLQISYGVLVAYLLYSFELKGKKKYMMLILSFLGSFYIFLYSLSATGLILYVSLVFFYLIATYKYECRKKINKLEKILINLVLPFSVFIAVIIPVVLQGETFDKVNQLFETRLSLTKTFVSNYGINLFGHNFSDLYYGLTLDSSYPYLLMYGGLIVFVIVIVLYVFLIKDSVKQYNESLDYRDAVEISILLSFVIAAISEPFFFNTSYKNVTWLFLGSYVWKKIKKDALEFQIIKKEMQFDIPINKLLKVKKQFCNSYIKNIKAIISISIILAFISSIFVFKTFNIPKTVYALRSSCQTTEDSESIYISEENALSLNNDSDVWFLNYKDEETPMLKFDGSIAYIDRYRMSISMFIWGYAFINIILAIGFFYKNSKDCKRYNL